MLHNENSEIHHGVIHNSSENAISKQEVNQNIPPSITQTVTVPQPTPVIVTMGTAVQNEATKLNLNETVVIKSAPDVVQSNTVYQGDDRPIVTQHQQQRSDEHILIRKVAVISSSSATQSYPGFCDVRDLNWCPPWLQSRLAKKKRAKPKSPDKDKVKKAKSEVVVSSQTATDAAKKSSVTASASASASQPSLKSDHQKTSSVHSDLELLKKKALRLEKEKLKLLQKNKELEKEREEMKKAKEMERRQMLLLDKPWRLAESPEKEADQKENKSCRVAVKLENDSDVQKVRMYNKKEVREYIKNQRKQWSERQAMELKEKQTKEQQMKEKLRLLREKSLNLLKVSKSNKGFDVVKENKVPHHLETSSVHSGSSSHAASSLSSESVTKAQKPEEMHPVASEPSDVLPENNPFIEAGKNHPDTCESRLDPVDSQLNNTQGHSCNDDLAEHMSEMVKLSVDTNVATDLHVPSVQLTSRPRLKAPTIANTVELEHLIKAVQQQIIEATSKHAITIQQSSSVMNIPFSLAPATQIPGPPVPQVTTVSPVYNVAGPPSVFQITGQPFASHQYSGPFQAPQISGLPLASHITGPSVGPPLSSQVMGLPFHSQGTGLPQTSQVPHITESRLISCITRPPQAFQFTDASQTSYVPTVGEASPVSWMATLSSQTDAQPKMFLNGNELSYQSGSVSQTLVSTQLGMKTVEVLRENFKLATASPEGAISGQPACILQKGTSETSGVDLHKKINALLLSRAQEKAAIKIQANFRGYLTRKNLPKNRNNSNDGSYKNAQLFKYDEMSYSDNHVTKDVPDIGDRCKAVEIQNGDTTPDWLKPKAVRPCPNNVLSAAMKQYVKLQKLGLLDGPPINLPDDSRPPVQSSMQPSHDIALQTDTPLSKKLVDHRILNYARLSPEKDISSQISHAKKSKDDLHDDMSYNLSVCSRPNDQKEFSPTVSSTTGESVVVSTKNSNQSQKFETSSEKTLGSKKQSHQSSSLDRVSHENSLSLVPPKVSLVRRWKPSDIQHGPSASKSDSMLEMTQEKEEQRFVSLQTSSSDTYDSHSKFALQRRKPRHRVPRKQSSVKSTSPAMLEAGEMVVPAPDKPQFQQFQLQEHLDCRDVALHKTQQADTVVVTSPAQLEGAQIPQKVQVCQQQGENCSRLSKRITELREMCSEFNQSLEANRQSFDQHVHRNRAELETIAEQMAEKGRQAIEEFMTNYRKQESSISLEPQFVPTPMMPSSATSAMSPSEVASAFEEIQKDLGDVHKIVAETLVDSSCDASFRSVSTFSKQPNSEDLELGLSVALEQSISSMPEQNESSCTQKQALAIAACNMYDELIRDEENKCKQQNDLFKERLKLLTIRTQSSLEWLLFKKQEYRSAERNDKLSSIRKKQRGVVIKYYEEKENILQSLKMQQQNSSDRITTLKKQQKAHKEIINRLLNLCEYSSEPENKEPSVQNSSGSVHSKYLQDDASPHDSTSEIFEEILYDSSTPHEKPESEVASFISATKSSTLKEVISSTSGMSTKLSACADSEAINEEVAHSHSAAMSSKGARNYCMSSRMREVTPKNSFSSIETVLDGSVMSRSSVCSARDKENIAKSLGCASVQTIELTLGKDENTDSTIKSLIKNENNKRKMLSEKRLNYEFREVHTQTQPTSKNSVKSSKSLRDVITSPLSVITSPLSAEDKENESPQASHVSEELDTAMEHNSSSSILESLRPSTVSDNCSKSNQLSCKSAQISEHIEEKLSEKKLPVTISKSRSFSNILQASCPLEENCNKRMELGIKTPLSLPPTRRHKRRHSSGSDESFIYSQNETLSEQSDVEGRIAALREQLERRKQEAEKLIREQKRKMRERLKAKEESLLKQIEAYDEFIHKTKQDLEQDLNSSSSSVIIMKPKIKQPRVAEKKQTAKPLVIAGSVVLDTSSKTVSSIEIVPSVSSSEAEQVHSVLSNHSIASVSDLESIASAPSTAQESVPEEIANSSGNEASVSNAVSEEEQSREMSVISEREDGSHESSYGSSSPKSVSQEVSIPTAIQSPVKLGESYDDHMPVSEEGNCENSANNVSSKEKEEILSLCEEHATERASCDRYSDDFEATSVNSDLALETSQSVEGLELKEENNLILISIEPKYVDQINGTTKEELLADKVDGMIVAEELDELEVMVDKCSLEEESSENFFNVDSMKIKIVEEELKEDDVKEAEKIITKDDCKEISEERIDEKQVIDLFKNEKCQLSEIKGISGCDMEVTEQILSSGHQMVNTSSPTQFNSEKEPSFFEDPIKEINLQEISSSHKHHIISSTEKLSTTKELKGLPVYADKLSLVESITDLIIEQILSEPLVRNSKDSETAVYAGTNLTVHAVTHDNEIIPQTRTLHTKLEQHKIDNGLDSVDGSFEACFIPADEFSFKEASFVNTSNFPLVTHRPRDKEAINLERSERITNLLLEESMKNATEEVVEICKEKCSIVANEETAQQSPSVDVRKRVGEIMTEAKLSPLSVREKCRVQELMVTTYDLLSPVDMLDSAQQSPVDAPDCISLTGSSVKDFPNTEQIEGQKTPVSNQTEVGVGILDLSKVSPAECENEWFDEDYGLSRRREAEELRRQQLRIEREIQEIQQAQEQCPYFYIREIPNKPPPPYTPPNQAARVQALPWPPSQEEVSSLVSCAAGPIYDTVQEGSNPDMLPVPPALDSKAAFGRFLFQLSCQLVKDACGWEVSQRRPCLPWEWTPRIRWPPPRSRQAVLEQVQKEVSVMFRFVSRASSDGMGAVRWGHKKRDLVDDLLVREGHKEEAGWTSYGEDEVAVKNELTDTLLVSLLDDAVSVLQDVVAKRFAKTV